MQKTRNELRFNRDSLVKRLDYFFYGGSPFCGQNRNFGVSTYTLSTHNSLSTHIYIVYPQFKKVSSVVQASGTLK